MIGKYTDPTAKNVSEKHDEYLAEAYHAVAAFSGGAAAALVDCVSFEVMRRRGITRAFAFDRRFADAGFELFPS